MYLEEEVSAEEERHGEGRSAERVARCPATARVWGFALEQPTRFRIAIRCPATPERVPERVASRERQNARGKKTKGEGGTYLEEEVSSQEERHGEDHPLGAWMLRPITRVKAHPYMGT